MSGTEMRCPHCKVRTLVAIEVKVGGERMVMRNCSACDLRWWEGPRGPVPFRQILAGAARRAS